MRSMGFRIEGILAATVLPAILVAVLYTGQWVMMHLDGHLWTIICEFGSLSSKITLFVRSDVSTTFSERLIIGVKKL